MQPVIPPSGLRGLPGPPSAKARLGRYELVAKLAAGGMGEIFLARLEGAAGFEKLYAVKRVLPHLAGDLRFRSMLIDEARIASKLSHPNICQVYELGETDGELYIAMEYLEGVTLLPILRHASQQQRPLELGLVAGLVQQMTEALHYAHELRDRDGTPLNIVHRDVTPSNVFVTENGIAKILDFGIAKARTISSNTQTGTIKGKHAYMAPEQLRGAALDRRVDVFAVGVLVFEMLALRRLFQRRTDYLTLQAVMEEPIPDVRQFRRDVPEALAAVLGRALERDRDQRYETVRQLGAAVATAVAGVERVWTASELGDQLRLRFGAELERRNSAVLSAVARPADASGIIPSLEELEVRGRQTTVSGLELGDERGSLEGGERDDDDGDLPSVDSAIHQWPTLLERTPAAAGPTASPVASPLAFAATAALPALVAGPEPTGARAAMQAMTSSGSHAALPPGAGYPIGNSSGSIPVMPYLMAAGSAQASPPRRSWPWVLFAMAVLGLAGAALAIVWRDSQRQQTVLVVQRGSAEASGAEGEAAGAPSQAGGSAEGGAPGGQPPIQAERSGAPDDGSAAPSAAGSAGKKPSSGSVRRDPKRLLREQIAALRPEVTRCLGQHASATTAVEGTVVLHIERRGKVSSVEIRPSAIAGTTLGSCIKSTFAAQRFPEQSESLEITVPFSTKLRPAL